MLGVTWISTGCTKKKCYWHFATLPSTLKKMLGHFVYSYSRARMILYKMNGTEFFLVFFAIFCGRTCVVCLKWFFPMNSVASSSQLILRITSRLKLCAMCLERSMGKTAASLTRLLTEYCIVSNTNTRFCEKKREWKTVDDHYRQTRRGEGDRWRHAAC